MVDLKARPSRMGLEQFLATYGGVYEHSPHFARAVFQHSARGTLDSVEGLADALRSEVKASGYDAQSALIQAHPDLANRLGVALTQESSAEQAGAGLDRCTPGELADFTRLNDAYKAKFGFPFIKAVRGFSRAQILEEFRDRLDNDPDTEFAAALAEIHKIARLRLEDLA